MEALWPAEPKIFTVCSCRKFATPVPREQLYLEAEATLGGWSRVNAQAPESGLSCTLDPTAY